MSIRNIQIREIAKEHLQNLIDNKVPEDKNLEYKRDLPGSTDSDKKEFLYDISSFANTSGGDLIYGIGEASGLATTLSGFPSASIDKEILRLQNLVRDGLRPSLSGLQMIGVDIGNDHAILIVRIPKSFLSPHQVIFQNAFRIYGRHSNGKYQIEIDEIRSAVLQSSSVQGNARSRRIDRVAKITADEIAVNLVPGARIVTHAVPFMAISNQSSIDIRHAFTIRHLLEASLDGGGVTKYNLEGIIAQNRVGEYYEGYAQLYRDAQLEIVEYVPDWVPRQDSVLPAISFEELVFRHLNCAKNIYKFLSVDPPFAILMSLLGFKGRQMGVDPFRFRHPGTGSFDSDALLVPDVVIDTLEGDTRSQAKPIIDMVWNATGWPGSVHYSSDGTWKGGR